MAVIFKQSGDLFKESVQAIVNPVNCVGVMGAGLAKVFKMKFPANFSAYKQVCADKTLKIGTVFVFEENDRIIINLPTKNHWKDSSKLEYVRSGVKALINTVQGNSESGHINSVALTCSWLRSWWFALERRKRVINR